jgi:hypothetical protein
VIASTPDNLWASTACYRGYLNVTLTHLIRLFNCSKFAEYFYLSVGAGVEPSPLLLRPFIDLLHQPLMTDDDCGAIGGVNEWQGKGKAS